MFKLLNANFSRLKHSKMLYVIIIITVIIALFFIFNHFKVQLKVVSEIITYDIDNIIPLIKQSLKVNKK